MTDFQQGDIVFFSKKELSTNDANQITFFRNSKGQDTLTYLKFCVDFLEYGKVDYVKSILKDNRCTVDFCQFSENPENDLRFRITVPVEFLTFKNRFKKFDMVVLNSLAKYREDQYSYALWGHDSSDNPKAKIEEGDEGQILQIDYTTYLLHVDFSKIEKLNVSDDRASQLPIFLNVPFFFVDSKPEGSKLE